MMNSNLKNHEVLILNFIVKFEIKSKNRLKSFKTTILIQFDL